MKLSTLIAKLNVIRQLEGDLDVVIGRRHREYPLPVKDAGHVSFTMPNTIVRFGKVAAIIHADYRDED